MTKATAIAPANIAFIKYWGRQNHKLFIPANTSLSMNLGSCLTTTTIELDSNLKQDEVTIAQTDGDYTTLEPNTEKNRLVFAQIDRLRGLAGAQARVKVQSQNNFPSDSGIASSASGFAALTTALLQVFGLEDKIEDKSELANQTRLSGAVSAARSCLGGFVQLDQTGLTTQVAPETHWNLVDLVVIVDSGQKSTSSSQGHLLAETSPYFQTRLKEMQPRIQQVRQSILNKDLATLGPLIEAESTSMHAVMMTSNPPIYYWQPESLAIMQAVRQWRGDGLESYFTLDAGANVHVICEESNSEELTKRLEELNFVQKIIANRPSQGVRLSREHLF